MKLRMLELANLILVVGPSAAAHDVRQKFQCERCNVKVQNTFQIVWRGNSGNVVNGAGIKLSTA